MKTQTLRVCLLNTYGKSLNQVPTKSQKQQTPLLPSHKLPAFLASFPSVDQILMVLGPLPLE